MNLTRRVLLKAGAVGLAVLAAVVEACDSGGGGGGYGFGSGDNDRSGYGYGTSYGFGLGPLRERFRRAMGRDDVGSGPGRRVG